jgi:hypothetical protein
MNNYTKRFVTFFLASLILFTSSGFGLVEHSCSLRGKKTYSFVNKNSCNSCTKHQSKSNQKTSFSRDKCCESKQVEKTQNISESLVNITGKFVKNATDFIAKSASFVFYKAIDVVINFKNNNSDEPNSLFGKSLLHFISLLRL